MPRSRLAVLAALPLAVGLVAGCSSHTKSNPHGSSTPAAASTQATASSAGSALASLSADELLAKTRSALQAADQLRVKGAASSDGGRFDIDYSYVGTNSGGMIALDGQSVELSAVDHVVYVRPSDAYWKGVDTPPSVTKLVSGKWIKVTGGDAKFESFTSLSDRAEFAQIFLSPEGTLKLGTPKTVNGTDCLAIDSSKGGTLYVSKADARPIQIRNASAGQIDISYTGVAVPRAPAAGDVIDFSKIAGR